MGAASSTRSATLTHDSDFEHALEAHRQSSMTKHKMSRSRQTDRASESTIRPTSKTNLGHQPKKHHRPNLARTNPPSPRARRHGESASSPRSGRVQARPTVTMSRADDHQTTPPTAEMTRMPECKMAKATPNQSFQSDSETDSPKRNTPKISMTRMPRTPKPPPSTPAGGHPKPPRWAKATLRCAGLSVAADLPSTSTESTPNHPNPKQDHENPDRESRRCRPGRRFSITDLASISHSAGGAIALSLPVAPTRSRRDRRRIDTAGKIVTLMEIDLSSQNAVDVTVTSATCEQPPTPSSESPLAHEFEASDLDELDEVADQLDSPFSFAMTTSDAALDAEWARNESESDWESCGQLSVTSTPVATVFQSSSESDMPPLKITGPALNLAD